MNYPAIHCLHPKKIINRYTKDVIYVPCMKCMACNNMKSSFSAMKCNLESKYHKYCYFGTLTYSNDYVPLADVFDDNGKKFLVDVCGDGEILGELSADINDIQELKKAADTFNFIPYLRKRDLQLFFKRLRKYIYKRTNEKIRFYATGEYGPLHRRPHYHFLIWFEKTETKKIIQCAVRACWPFGRIDIQKPKYSATQYVAGYLNGNCDLPEIYKSSQIRPFSCHSQFLGEKIFSRSKEEIYESPVDKVVRISTIINGVDTEVNMWRSLTSRYFPVPKGFRSLDSFQCAYSYRVAKSVAEIYGKNTPYQQSKKIVDILLSMKDYPSFVNYEFSVKNNHFLMYEDNESFFLKWIIKTCDINIFCPDNRNKYISRVYSVLRLSQHFLDFVCGGDYSYNKTLECMSMIKTFYNNYDMLRLTENIQKQVEILDKGYDLQDFEFDNGYLVSVKKDTPMYKEFLEKQMDLYVNRVKHKKQNEKTRNLKKKAIF